MLTPYGTSNILIMLGLSLVFFILSYFLKNTYIAFTFGVLGVVLAFFTFWFFKIRKRKIPDEVQKNEEYLIAPADGKVVEVIEEIEKHYLKDSSIRMSIFLSPIDVHVNRSPVAGTVDFYEYVPGDYLVAFHPKSSELNEHSRIGVKNKYGKVFFKQIVGVLARRIVCETKVGDKLAAGEKFGMMKFGSRMDIAVPVGSEILIKKGDRVIAGETIIAKLKTN